MSIFFEYGEESHDEYYSYGMVRVRDEAQLQIFLNDQGFYAWSKPCTADEYVDASGYDFEAAVHEAMIAKNIAAALRRKRLARNAYKAPSLADLWPPTGA